MMHHDNNRSGKDRSRRRERAIWGSVTALACVAVLAFAIAPSLAAQSSAETNRVLDTFEGVYRFIEQNYVDDVDPNVLLEGALKGMFESLGDPFSAYLDSDQMRALTDDTNGEFGGVGMYISKQQTDRNDSNTGFVEVIAPIEDTPAFQAGVRAGDLIVAIKDENDDDFKTTTDLSIDDAVNLLRGAPGTSVTIRLRRGTRAEFPVTLERAVIEVPTVKYAMIGDSIGFLRIINFTPHTADRVHDAVEFFKQHDYTSMVIDLRSNPGGLLNGVVDVANLFFDSGTIVGTSGRDPQLDQRFTAKPGVEIDKDIPIVVMVDGGSASAAEILSGALQDRGRAYLIGQKTFGKGSVQQVRRIGDGGFRLTMSRYYLPSGRFIDKIGVEPDEVVKPPELSDDQTQAYADMIASGKIATWVTANLNATDDQIDAFVATLQADGDDLPDRWIKVSIKNELNRQNNVQIIYDLQFDTVLQEAVRLLQSGEVSAN